MKRIMGLSALTLLLAFAARADAPAKPPSTEDLQVAQVAEAKWVTPKVPGMPPGPQAALIGADPATGGSVAYVKLPPGYVFPEHWHSATEYAVLVSGKSTLKIEGKSHQMVLGSYAIIPPKTKHEVTCAAGADCVLLVRRAGPTDYNFVGK